MSTKFKTAAAAAAALAEDPTVEQRVDLEVRRGQFVSTLIHLRLSKGITQQQVAEKMQCDPSKISRMESGNDPSFSDIMGYLGALNLGINIMFDDPSLPAASRIKQCVFEIHRHLESLVDLAKTDGKDTALISKIHEFYGEVLFNFVTRYEESYQKLPAIEIPPPQVCSKQPVAKTAKAESPAITQPV
jgi:transcriptional regulator with XRE-family HTH domain